jgi:mannose-binding lectin 1
MHLENQQHWNNLMARIVPIDDRGAATIRNVEKVERTTMQILRDLESKDFKEMMDQIHRALESQHGSLAASLPGLVGGGTFLFFSLSPSLYPLF